MTHLLVVKSAMRSSRSIARKTSRDAIEGLTLEVVTHKRTFDQTVGWFRARIRKIA
jgi:hypothetical protein